KELKQPQEEYLLLSPRNINSKGDVILTKQDAFVNREVLLSEQNISHQRFQRSILRKGDILITRGGKLKISVISYEPRRATIASEYFFIVRSAQADYLAHYLSSDIAQAVFRIQ